MRQATTLPLPLILLALAACAGQPPASTGHAGHGAAAPAATGGEGAPLFDNLGSHHRPISTQVPLAQRYFDQGLTLAYGFNHAEAARSFREAARLDPDCAICSWGLALVLGPNINAAMEAGAVPEAWQALAEARRRAPKASPIEQALIEALGRRYAPEPPADRSTLDAAYAAAMRELARRFPDDLDAATLFVEALMDTIPWNYWDREGRPYPATEEILATLESVVARDPDHPGALHYYIHAVEASPDPERGEAAADRLGGLVPGAGHLVHMPSHIYLRVGRYRDAAIANEKADAADDAYAAQCHAQGIYPLVYHSHNVHFLWAALAMEGRGAEAIRAALRVRQKAPPGSLREAGMETLQFYWATPLFAYVRFGKWDEILGQPKPEEDLKFPVGVWHYARAIALTRKGRLAEAAGEVAALSALAQHGDLAELKVWGFNSFQALLQIARDVAAAELAAARGDVDQAVSHLRWAVLAEDRLIYQEPPDWHQPVRQVLGAVLLAAGRAGEAEAVFREDLSRHPENGWSLFGLARSLEAQGKAEAAAVRQRFETAWAGADVALSSSRL
jgi:tetratricopeptide (TPR) repeat protein